ncbi:MAG: diacylglycerol kinase [Aquisalimonadaceae bacterium]
MKPGRTGISRLYHAALYSFAGLRFAYRFESAFRQELWLALLLTPVGLLVGDNAAERGLLVGTLLIVLITELLNTALEAAVDRVGDEFHALAGSAKDAASAAVFVSLLLTVLVWGLIIWEKVVH